MATKKKASAKKFFSAEAKAKAVRLLAEEGNTLKKVAKKIGCSVASLQSWKKAAGAVSVETAVEEFAEVTAKPTKKTKKVGRRGKKMVKKTAAKTAPVQKSSITFDEFVQDYWSECEGATDALRLSPDITPRAVEYVNNVLRYAYDKFGGQ